ncbi:hypothetical protein MWU52_16935 [Jannaschia sp. S6380]|uniref:hypothetical protein n=1 Tax=Jannaschia sp. S6380 TaxID=2926408 RepID=UPI001FF5CBE4|nr:hypothetical protein [Jannaschia sp. S6380]MCK0169242.1 hypothetical protein [Jannaschia sp. S6380]
MRRLLTAISLAAPLAAPISLPVQAQEAEPPTVMERGLRLFLDGLMDEMEPALRDLEGLAQDAAPFLQELQRNLGEVVEDIDAYEAPEILPNGDILIRRKEPLVPGEPVVPNPDGSIDL